MQKYFHEENQNDIGNFLFVESSILPINVTRSVSRIIINKLASSQNNLALEK